MAIKQIVEHLKACNAEHVRAVLEPDDVMFLLDYIERQEKPSAEPKPDESVDLESMTKDDLLAYAESHGVVVAKSKTKAEIIEAIESENK